MNDVLQKIMTFINENTYVLIGICIFLIFVLIGYLIDNSVKSKRVRKDIKNKDQVPENIKNDIIKEAESNKEKTIENETATKINDKKENIFLESNITDDNIKIEPDIDLSKNINTAKTANEDLNTSFNLDNSNITEPLSFNESVSNVENNNFNFVEDVSNNNQVNSNIDSPFSLDLNDNSNNINNESIMQKDPDEYLISKQSNNENLYKNDKKLSEILLEMNKKENINEVENENIFDNTSNITVNNDVQEKIEIEPISNASDELDQIMKKLSSMNNTQEDNYTNIF